MVEVWDFSGFRSRQGREEVQVRDEIRVIIEFRIGSGLQFKFGLGMWLGDG